MQSLQFLSPSTSSVLPRRDRAGILPEAAFSLLRFHLQLFPLVTPSVCPGSRVHRPKSWRPDVARR
jgi:hypothetical protein